ncbi:MAG: short-chain dehydrogenase [Ilumatobacter coccineus]|uniref:Short-chain dehydrogenase n=1 Tax=Ilumatobacter coccineus TaxID=467094 RepID=A0A2G6KD84_9ACTN|nr:MAG: short-chain dehydrogenase [Ilumatobacter coccineus]
MELTNRVVVVTGGGSGIGAALCRAAHQAGARHIMVADRDGKAAAAVASEVDGTDIVVDVSKEADIARLVSVTEKAHGPIGVFVSNAGFVTTAGLEDTNEAIQTMWNVHVMAHIYAARAVLPSMIARGEGYLLNTSSAAGLLTQIGSMAYSVTKAASIALADWLAITHHHQGIRVSVLCPQAVDTAIVRNSPDYDPSRDGDGSIVDNVATIDGVLSADQVAAECIDALRDERFLVLPHPDVAVYAQRKAADRDRWLEGMRRFQDLLYPDGNLPGDAIAPSA